MSPRSDETSAPQGRIAVVTGAGRGLGWHLASQLAGQGLRVAAIGRRLEDLERLAAEHAQGAIMPVKADVSDIDALRAAFARIDAEMGPPDILINNAAVYPRRDFLEETPESFREAMEINIGGMASCTMLALERMVQRGHGRIINVGSFAFLRPLHLSSAYCVSKSACHFLTQSMVEDLRDRFPDIVINEWMPGRLNTKMGVPDGMAPDIAAKWGVALALMTDRTLNGAIFEKDCEHLPPISRKRRLLNAVTGRTLVPRRIEPIT